MEGGDYQAFNVNFSVDGAAKLKERVNQKLQEFMGDYTDDTLVEYVIVLLRNGRHKEEAKNELNVFLGSDSDSFVNWLWDHLSSNLHLYVQPQERYLDGDRKGTITSGVEVGNNDAHPFDIEVETGKSVKESKSRRNREWKGLVRDVTEPPPLRSSEVESFHVEEKNHHKVGHLKRSHSPRPPVQKKRSRQDERQSKREVPSHPRMKAPSRLLQFAVRDAVGTIRSPILKAEPSVKRLRSVVSTSSGDTFQEHTHSQGIRSVARMSSAMATAMKASAEAAEDVSKVKGVKGSNVFDRLGHDMEALEMTNPKLDSSRALAADEHYEDFDHMQQVDLPSYIRSEDSGENMTVLDMKTNRADDYNSDAEYGNINGVGRRALKASRSGTSLGNKEDSSLTVQCSVANNKDNGVRRTRVKTQNPSSAVPNASRKIVNISVNVNTWKPPHYQVSRDISEMEHLKAKIQENEVAARTVGVRVTKENNTTMAVKENELPGFNMQKESQANLSSSPGSFSAGRVPEDADSRAIFVNNVHFAATKESLSLHFSKFGEVLKVIILTDATSGLSKGSAYIEFTRKEAADLALSLDGTSFMSRILKVVKKSSVSVEVSPAMTRPHVVHASPFLAARVPRVPFPRAHAAAFRPRLPVKTGARSLQWKREHPEGSTNPRTGVPLSANNVPSPTARSLTYVRPEAKPVGNSGNP
ncbi:hypothetical protein MKW98_018426 [Papaver atlanticum]|uniref:RRM domain-containing protein n=1 Tax=Papaver atlanticum TaxID=357466 RepID=A0AAD4T3L2_9MAGN|nr:hypothetical protein MKW98_018426 [Papaver atlanticum]